MTNSVIYWEDAETMILVIVLGAALVHLVSFGIFLWLAARAAEGDEDESESEGVRDDNVVSISELGASKLANQSMFERSGHASIRRGGILVGLKPRHRGSNG